MYGKLYTESMSTRSNKFPYNEKLSLCMDKYILNEYVDNSLKISPDMEALTTAHIRCTSRHPHCVGLWSAANWWIMNSNRPVDIHAQSVSEMDAGECSWENTPRMWQSAGRISRDSRTEVWDTYTSVGYRNIPSPISGKHPSTVLWFVWPV